MEALSASALADLAGTTAAEVQRMVDLGVLVARDDAGPFRATDVQKVRIAAACERAGLPMEGIAASIRAWRSPHIAGRADCRLCSWRPPRTSGGRCARRGPTGR